MNGVKNFLFVILVLLISGINFAEQPVVVQEFIGQIDFVRGRVTQLADAVPQSSFEWRPADEVRSISEVYLHVAFANYLSVTISGGTVPEEVGFVMDFNKIKEWDTQTIDKAMIIEKMNKSFDTLKERVAALTDDDLNREVEFFGMKMSVRNFMVTMIAHCHEHLGQSIAYARMNGVTPPWSKSEG